MKNNDLRLLIVGTYPPPYGGIATHLVSLVPSLVEKGVSNIAIVSFKDEESIERKKELTVYNYNVRKQFWRLLLPNNWPLFFITIITLWKHKLGLKTLAVEAIKSILVNHISKLHKSNVSSFYQTNLHFEIVPLSRYWKKRIAIVLTIFGEYFDDPVFFKEHASLFNAIVEIPYHVASSSCHCANSLKVIGVNRKVEPIYYGVNIQGAFSDSLRTEFRDNYKINSEHCLLLFMGRFSGEMGIDSIL
jgi:glycosyltransferase involved in cell wall biosynthesis